MRSGWVCADVQQDRDWTTRRCCANVQQYLQGIVTQGVLQSEARLERGPAGAPTLASPPHQSGRGGGDRGFDETSTPLGSRVLSAVAASIPIVHRTGWSYEYVPAVGHTIRSRGKRPGFLVSNRQLFHFK